MPKYYSPCATCQARFGSAYNSNCDKSCEFGALVAVIRDTMPTIRDKYGMEPIPKKFDFVSEFSRTMIGVLEH